LAGLSLNGRKGMNLFLDIVPISPAAALFNERMTVVLGFITLISAVAVIATCRSFIVLLSRVGVKRPLASRAYRAVYGWHFYYWWVFAIALTLHVMTAVTHATVSGRFDVVFHWWILGLGLASLGWLFPVQLSCRSTLSFINSLSGTPATGNRFFNWFYRRHGVLWWGLLLFMTAHVGVAVAHVNWWPRGL
jgi:hypothetical protein